MAKMFLFDSVQKEKVLFESQEENKVKMYVCGPTVYDDAHLGHARSAIVFDLLHRVLKANGYEVTFVKNFTDIDDKIIKKLDSFPFKKNNTSDKKLLKRIKLLNSKNDGEYTKLVKLTANYMTKYKKDMKALNILQNTIEPKATESLEAMENLIENLLKENIAYKLEDGVYFDTSKDKNYGNISKRASDENSISRVESNLQKRDAKDFALWKYNTNSVSFKTHFGEGRPGWHCECSAMIDKHLANHELPYAIDIHGGGADLLFPHHENEASQTRMAYGQELSKYWVHNGFVNINGEKMSKSLGNSFFLKDALKEYSGEVIRFYMLTTHYRADFGFNTEDLEASKKRLDKLYRLKKRVYDVVKNDTLKVLSYKENILEALNDDMNTSKAFATIDEFVNFANDKLDSNPKDKNLKSQIVELFDFISDILGIGYQDAYNYFQFGMSEDEKEKIKNLIEKRTEAKKEKNFVLSDAIRDQLTNMGIRIMDTVNDTKWEKLNKEN
jgi:cysteinyl-tRNA synthetase